jgi:hypothetical protein
MVCASTSITREKRKELKQLVLFMGGEYLDDLRDTVTHVISESVKSLVYYTPARNGVRIMKADWVSEIVFQKTNKC